MILYSIGTALLTSDEIHDAKVPEKVDDLLASLGSGRSFGPLKLDNGVLSAEMVTGDTGRAKRGARAAAASKLTGWEPIGVGKPLTIDIREVYTGKYPGGRWFGGDKGMLVTSAVKSIATYDAKPLAVNFLTRKTQKGARLARPKASEEGTPVIFYSPAMTDRSLTVDLSIVFDEFPKEAFEAVGSAFKSAAGLPVFLSHSAYLIAAGEIARIAGAIGEKLFDAKPVFEVTESVDLQLPGEVSAVAGFMLMVPSQLDKLDPAFRDNYELKDGNVVDKAGKPYQGDVPYIVLAVDGTEREDLKAFAPTAASAAVLSRFHGMKQGQSTGLEPLTDALKLYNDFTYRSEVDRIDKKLAGLQPGDEKDALTKRREALTKNIGSDLLKP